MILVLIVLLYITELCIIFHIIYDGVRKYKRVKLAKQYWSNYYLTPGEMRYIEKELER